MVSRFLCAFLELQQPPRRDDVDGRYVNISEENAFTEMQQQPQQEQRTAAVATTESQLNLKIVHLNLSHWGAPSFDSFRFSVPWTIYPSISVAN